MGAELYTTNGDTNDHLYQTDRVQSFTPEGTGGTGTGSGFIFQDVEADVQQEFEDHVQFALDLARSADDPDNPVSHLGNEAPDFVVDRFNVSYGNPQTVQVNARRDLGPIRLRYRINGGRVRTASTSEWRGGERYGDEGDYWYHRMRGQVRGTDPGDEVEVWFDAPREDVESRSFTYEVRSDSNARVLVLAVEDYTGFSTAPPYPSAAGPFYLDYYTDALEANGIEHDVWDYDAEGRRAPDPLGVLSHYDAVIWYTGNDLTTRSPNQGGVADLQAHETIISVRDFVNEGGRVALTGASAGRQYDAVEYPEAGYPLSQCDGNLNTTNDGKCQPLSNDFIQYYLGSYIRTEGGGLAADGSVLPVTGLSPPLDGWSATLNDPAQSAGNQAPSQVPGVSTTSSHIVTSSVLDPATYPQFASEQAADWLLPGGGGFDPHTGDWYMYSQNSDRGYKRLTRTIDLTGVTAGQAAELSFWTSYNTEPDWDYVFVEGHEVGQDDWTTLPDENGHTSQDTGRQLPGGLDRGHPQPPRAATRRSTRRPASARPPGPPVSGTRPPATRPAGRSGGSTSAAGPASRWRSGSRSPPITAP